MFSILVKKQFAEIFQNYFIDRKKGGARSSKSTIVLFILYAVLMLYLAAMFFGLAFALAGPLYEAGAGWLYFTFFILLSVVLGTFASVFSTYSGLYLSKDNDLLLSMPIPIGTIVLSRIVGVYLMGLLYSSLAMLPAIIGYLIFAEFSINALIGCLLQLFLVSLTVLVLSCALGYVVARISVKLKNKSFITVIISLVAVGAYMYAVYNFNSVLDAFLQNAGNLSESIKNSFYPAYLIGSAGAGDFLSMLIVTAIVGAAAFLTYYLISRSFVKIATSIGNVSTKKKAVKHSRARGSFGALFNKELSRFLGSAAYMLNCGLGVIFIPIVGVMMLIKGGELASVLAELTGDNSIVIVLVIAAMCMVTTMVDTAAPSISLEGKNLWQLKSLPIKAETVLLAKFTLQFLLTSIPTLFSSVCAAIALKTDVLQTILIIVVPLIFAVLNSLFALFLGIKMPNLNWTNEIVPIKQGLNVGIALFGGWLFIAIIIAPYFIVGSLIGYAPYLIIMSSIFIVLSVVLTVYLKKRGTKILSEL